MVQYANIPGAEGYRVGDDGSVWSRWIPRRRKLGDVWNRLKPYKESCGYLQVDIRRDGIGKPFLVHRLVLESFTGPCPDGMECLHADDDKENCRLDNVSWGTRKKNMEDASKRGRLPIKYSDETVREIRRLRSEKKQIKDIATVTKCSFVFVRGVLDGSKRQLVSKV